MKTLKRKVAILLVLVFMITQTPMFALADIANDVLEPALTDVEGSVEVEPYVPQEEAYNSPTKECDFCFYCSECLDCGDCLDFRFNIFNNGPLGSLSRPNQNLNDSNIIRMWTGFGPLTPPAGAPGGNSPVPLVVADSITATVRGGDCAMEFVRVNRMWVAGTGWSNNFNLIDVNTNASWEFIDLTITVHGQVYEVVLHNGNYVAVCTCDYCFYCGECLACGDCLDFRFDIFNNGPLGCPSRPNQHLYEANTIRMWTGFGPLSPPAGTPGGNSRLPLTVADSITATIRGGGCAMEFVNVRRQWVEGQGWTDYFTVIDVIKDAKWEFIDLTITVRGEVHNVVLHNGNYIAVCDRYLIISVEPDPAIVQRGGTVDITVTTRNMPDGAWINVSNFWLNGVYIVNPYRLYVVNNQVVFTIMATADAPLGSHGKAVYAQIVDQWGSYVILDHKGFVLIVEEADDCATGYEWVRIWAAGAYDYERDYHKLYLKEQRYGVGSPFTTNRWRRSNPLNATGTPSAPNYSYSGDSEFTGIGLFVDGVSYKFGHEQNDYRRIYRQPNRDMPDMTVTEVTWAMRWHFKSARAYLTNVELTDGTVRDKYFVGELFNKAYDSRDPNNPVGGYAAYGFEFGFEVEGNFIHAGVWFPEHIVSAEGLRLVDTTAELHNWSTERNGCPINNTGPNPHQTFTHYCSGFNVVGMSGWYKRLVQMCECC